MIKIFVKLYLVFILTTLVFFLFVAFTGDYLFISPLNKHRSTLYRGSFQLIIQEIQLHNADDWEDKVEELSSHFGYPLVLRKVNSFDSSVRKLITPGNIVMIEEDGAEAVLQQIGDTASVLLLSTEETYSQAMENISRGTLFLVEKILSTVERSNWPEKVVELSVFFDFPLSLLELSELHLTGTQLQVLNNGKIVSVTDQDNSQLIYKRIPESTAVIKAGPIAEITVLGGFLWLAFALCLLFGISFLLWVRPIWRDLRRLDLATNQFGAGKFEARVNLSPRSSLAVLAGTFNGMAERIEQLITARKELTDAVSHELRTPIARLRFSAEMLADAESKEEKERYLKEINYDAEEFDSLIDEFLTYARLDKQHPQLNFDEHNFCSWLQEILPVLRRNVQSCDIEIKTPSEMKDLHFQYDTLLLERAIANLVSNGCRYGGSKVILSMTSSDSAVQLFIDDNGQPIPASSQNDIFKPFVRLETSRNKTTGGYGLGLAIVQRIVSLHGGKVGIVPSKLGGTCFCITLPLIAKNSLY